MDCLPIIVNRNAFRVNEKIIERVKKHFGKNITFYDSYTDGTGLHFRGFEPNPILERVAAMGGDGTANGTANYLIGLRLRHIPDMAIIPAGTGNGYSAALDLPKNIIKAVKLAIEGEAKAIDVVHVTEPFDRYVLNLFDTGFMAQCLKGKDNIGKGMIAHTRAVFAELGHFKAFDLNYLMIDDEVVAENVKTSCIAAGKGYTPSTPFELEVLVQGELDDGLMRVAVYDPNLHRIFGDGLYLALRGILRMAKMKTLGKIYVERKEFTGKSIEFLCGAAEIQYDGNYIGVPTEDTLFKAHVEQNKLMIVR